jgi:hypothetical protein
LALTDPESHSCLVAYLKLACAGAAIPDDKIINRFIGQGSPEYSFIGSGFWNRQSCRLRLSKHGTVYDGEKCDRSKDTEDKKFFVHEVFLFL